MEFEFHPAKSQGNLAKHGIDFVTAQQVWADDERIVLASSYASELRQLVIGRIGDVLYTAITTQRGDRVRIISVRHARVLEREAYEDDRC